ncbi:Copia protein, partial [Mucuna pruriens]
MCYLRKIKGYMFTYRKFEGLEIIDHFDFDFVGCQDNKRSTFEYIYMLTKGAISWKSVKHTLIAPSTMGAEFVACFEASNHGIWLRNFVISLRMSFTPTTITKSKFIDIKFLVVKERVQNKQISIEHIGTSFMLADPLTKGLIPMVFHEHTAHMDIIPYDTLV